MNENVILMPPKEQLAQLYSKAENDIPKSFFVTLAEMICLNHHERILFERTQKQT